MSAEENSPELRAFLDSVLKSQGSGDAAWRNMGRWIGLYFQGLLDAGVEPESALTIAVGCQEAILRIPRQDHGD